MRLFVKDYKPYKGFYDLRDWGMPAKVFRKLWEVQDMLNHYNTHADYFKKYHPVMWEKAKEMSADYQQILFSFKGGLK